MPQQVTTKVEAIVRGISVSPDGKIVSAAVDWVDSATKTPRSRTNIAMTGGEVLQFSKKLGSASPKAADLAGQIASLVQSAVDELVRSGSLKY